MNELDVITLTNPTSEDFTVAFNGQPFTIKAHETTSFSKYVGFHIAKHLSTKMIEDEVPEKVKKMQPVIVAQRTVYDSHFRRIALYKILGDKDVVVQVIAAYPFKGFIGEMKEYEKFVEEQESEKSKKSEKPGKLEKAEKPEK